MFCVFLFWCVVFSDQTTSEAVQGTTLFGMQVWTGVLMRIVGICEYVGLRMNTYEYVKIRIFAYGGARVASEMLAEKTCTEGTESRPPRELKAEVANRLDLPIMFVALALNGLVCSSSQTVVEASAGTYQVIVWITTEFNVPVNMQSSPGGPIK